jgi:hypothetical protein
MQRVSITSPRRYRLKNRNMRSHIIPAIAALSLAAASLAAQAPAKPGTATKPAEKPAATAAKPAPKPEAPLLPSSFSGWETTSPKAITDPTQADAVNAAALKEYGFTDGLLADYARNGETLKIKALRFIDASGAYGAYSFYRHSGWPKEEIGTGATSNKDRVLFWVGNVVVDAQFSKISPMAGSALRDLASAIPVPGGNKVLPPPILGDLPQKEMDGQTTHYALGPAGYVGSAGAADPFGVLPPEMVGFDRGAETATATYKLRSGPAILTVINYPTPQMAAAQAKVIANYLKAGDGPGHVFTKPLKDSNLATLEVRRSGPLVAVVSGDAIPDEAHKLITTVHFDAESSQIPGGGDTEVQKTAKLLVAIITLVAVMFAAALLLAIFLGGGRAAYRFLRGKPVSSMYDQEFTKLDLE